MNLAAWIALVRGNFERRWPTSRSAIELTAAFGQRFCSLSLPCFTSTPSASCPIQPDHTAIEHRVLDNVAGHAGEFVGPAHALEGRSSCSTNAERTSSVMPAIIGVSKMPGAIATTRIPTRASSRAAGKVSEATPPLEAE